VMRAREVLEAIEGYWFFYSGVREQHERWLVYGFFKPEPYEVEKIGGVEATWKKFVANTRGGGTRYWRAFYNLDTDECVVSINSSR
jgi:hypothetical protein